MKTNEFIFNILPKNNFHRPSVANTKQTRAISLVFIRSEKKVGVNLDLCLQNSFAIYQTGV